MTTVMVAALAAFVWVFVVALLIMGCSAAASPTSSKTDAEAPPPQERHNFEFLDSGFHERDAHYGAGALWDVE